MARTGHIYDWDVNQNATFPAGITATSFNGPIANALTLNGVSYDGSAAVDVGSIDITHGGTGKTTRKEALTALLGQTNTSNLDAVLE